VAVTLWLRDPSSTSKMLWKGKVQMAKTDKPLFFFFLVFCLFVFVWFLFGVFFCVVFIVDSFEYICEYTSM